MSGLIARGGAMSVEMALTVPSVEVENLWFSYNRANPTLRNISLRVERGEVCMILGPSGSGKSTFLKVTKGILKPQSGRVSVLGLELSNGLTHSSRRELGCHVAYIPQNLGLVRNLTVTENTLMGALGRVPTFSSVLKLFPRNDRLQAMNLLDVLGIAHKQSEKVYELSGGERQRVAIARALMQKPRLILADEFVSQLDPITTREIMAIVGKIAASGVSFLVTTHEVELVAKYGDRAFFFRAGEKVHECNAKEVDMNSVTLLMGK